MKNYRNYAASLAAVSTLAAGMASAETVFWGGPVWSDDFESDGSTILTSAYTFEIGAFTPGFDIATEAVEDWADNWHVFDSALYDDDNMFFDAKADMDANGISNGTNADTSFDFRNKKLYIWVYNDNTPTDDFSRIGEEECHYEWAMVSGSDWTLSNDGGSQQTLPEQWRITNANEIVIGGINNTQGTDPWMYTSPSTMFDLQTHSVCLEVIPEPSTSLLSAFGLMLALGKRRRK